MIRYLTWRNIFGVLLLAILVMIWPLEWIGWYTVSFVGSNDDLIKVNAITGHLQILVPADKEKGTKIHWVKVGW